MQNVISFEKKQMPTDLLTLQEIEMKYKVKYNTAYKHIVLNSEVPYYKIGRNVRVSEKDFLAYMNNCLVSAKRFQYER